MAPRIALPMLLALSLAVGACESKQEPVPRRAPAPASASSSDAPAPAPASLAPPPASDPSEAEVRAFVTRWVTAQNDRHFEEYARMYTERFMGVKRVGSYGRRFDRRAWLADRKPMFDGKAQVRVSDLAFSRAPGVTRVTFTQEFVASGFRDIGRKELFLLATSGGISISREEMLSSQVTSGEQAKTGIMAYHRDGAVLARGFPKRKLTGKPRLISAPDAETVDIAFSVEPDALSEELRAWRGRSVTVYSARGESCRGPIARFEVRVHSVPHFGMRNVWLGQSDEPKPDREQIALAIHELAQDEEHFVVGVLERPCPGAWASAEALPFTPAQPVTGELAVRAVDAFKGLPGYAKLQRSFVEQKGDPARGWESVDGEVRVSVLRAPARRALLVVSARAGSGCGGFGGSLSGLWEVAGTEDVPQLKRVASFDEHLRVSGAVDVGGASGLALLAGPDGFTGEVVTVSPSAKDARRVLFERANWDCSC